MHGTSFGGSGAVGSHSYSLVRYNSDWVWFTDGTMSEEFGAADVKTVVLHEFGHTHGLDHPNNCTDLPYDLYTADERAAVMTPDFTKKWQINADDISLAQYYY